MQSSQKPPLGSGRRLILLGGLEVDDVGVEHLPLAHVLHHPLGGQHDPLVLVLHPLPLHINRRRGSVPETGNMGCLTFMAFAAAGCRIELASGQAINFYGRAND